MIGARAVGIAQWARYADEPHVAEPPSRSATASSSEGSAGRWWRPRRRRRQGGRRPHRGHRPPRERDRPALDAGWRRRTATRPCGRAPRRGGRAGPLPGRPAERPAHRLRVIARVAPPRRLARSPSTSRPPGTAPRRTPRRRTPASAGRRRSVTSLPVGPTATAVGSRARQPVDPGAVAAEVAAVGPRAPTVVGVRRHVHAVVGRREVAADRQHLARAAGGQREHATGLGGRDGGVRHRPGVPAVAGVEDPGRGAARGEVGVVPAGRHQAGAAGREPELALDGVGHPGRVDDRPGGAAVAWSR